MPLEPEHEWDGIADDLAGWMDDEVNYHVEALRGGARSPFSAQVTQKQAHDYWTRKIFQAKPDGSVDYDTPNKAGRDEILKKQGVKTYAEIVKQVTPKRPKGIRPPFAGGDQNGVMSMDNDPLYALTGQHMPEMPEDDEPVPEA